MCRTNHTPAKTNTTTIRIHSQSCMSASVTPVPAVFAHLTELACIAVFIHGYRRSVAIRTLSNERATTVVMGRRWRLVVQVSVIHHFGIGVVVPQGTNFGESPYIQSTRHGHGLPIW
jgi:hypothetical protein